MPLAPPPLQVLIRDIPEAKEMGLAQLCEFIEDCEFTFLSVQILHLMGEEGPRTKDPGGCSLAAAAAAGWEEGRPELERWPVGGALHLARPGLAWPPRCKHAAHGMLRMGCCAWAGTGSLLPP